MAVNVIGTFRKKSITRKKLSSTNSCIDTLLFTDLRDSRTLKPFKKVDHIWVKINKNLEKYNFKYGCDYRFEATLKKAKKGFYKKKEDWRLTHPRAFRPFKGSTSASG